MERLEAQDAADRLDGTPRARRLRQVSPQTGRFLTLMAATAPAGVYVEIGTSGGYSSLWIGLACRAQGRKLMTIEVDESKSSIARQTFHETGMEDCIELVVADARDVIRGLDGISFCFLDTEKELYGECYELVVPRMIHGALLLADNAIDSREVLQPMLDRAQADPRVDSVIVPIGKGVLLCRRV
jgi:predicted O-methyltransferase YrrM